MTTVMNLMLIVGMTLFVCSGAMGLVVFFGLYKILMRIGE
jgi:uncharacterized membrane protein